MAWKIRDKEAEVRALTVEVICQTVLYFSISKSAGTATVPFAAILPKSLRTMSTIMMFSARFFSEEYSCCEFARSSSGRSPLGIVPFIGLDDILFPSRLKNNSGEKEQIA